MLATSDQVAAVQRTVNAGVTYRTDAEQYGLPDLWRDAKLGGAGDCDDFALAKRRALLDAGAELAALRLAICRTPAGELHVVLIVTTERGDLVLDNLREAPVMRQELPYTWIAIEEAGQWFTVE